jgi:hypothetical protein
MISPGTLFNYAFPIWVAVLSVILTVTVALIGTLRNSQREATIERISSILKDINVARNFLSAQALMDRCKEHNLVITLPISVSEPLASEELQRRLRTMIDALDPSPQLPATPECFLEIVRTKQLAITPNPDHLAVVRILQAYSLGLEFSAAMLLALALVINQSIPDPAHISTEFTKAVSYAALGSLILSGCALMLTAYYVQGLQVLDSLLQLLFPQRRTR